MSERKRAEGFFGPDPLAHPVQPVTEWPRPVELDGATDELEEGATA